MLSPWFALECFVQIRTSVSKKGFWKTKYPSQHQQLQRRWLTQKQISTALRPFYFLVHPDLLTKFPKERVANESALKSLKNYISVVLDEHRSPVPIQTTFFLKPRQQTAPSLRQVTISLRDGTDIRKTVLNILAACQLPTSYVDSLPEV